MRFIEVLARFMTSPYGAGAASSIIAMWALSTYHLGLRRKTTPLIRDLGDAKQKLQTLDGETAFANGFEGFNESARQNTTLRTVWNETRGASP